MASNTACSTLRIVHLPAHLTDEKRDELLKKYGALHTKTIRKSENYSATFAEFPSIEIAMRAFMQLQSLDIKGRHISIEFAEKFFKDDFDNGIEQVTASEKYEDNEPGKSEDFNAFINKLNNWSKNYTFCQPPPPNISYKYPHPTRNILLRIAIQMIKEPAFYTQVLHLMNKMNLPPPFEDLDEEFPALKDIYDIENYEDIFGRVMVDNEEIVEEDAESEIESDNDDSRPQFIPTKRNLTQHKKRLKIPKFVNPMKQPTSTISSKSCIRPEDMFESVKMGEIKNLRIELKNVGELGNSEMNATAECSNLETEEGGFGLIFPPTTEQAKNEERRNESSNEKKDFITSEELAGNRISLSDQRLLPVFQNYHPGKPSCRLYIKNLSKHVDLNDLHYIYRRYVLSSLDSSESQYDIRLMQEGRMKGQAFVTFENMGQAQLALNETNGYILKDKPMVVQFAKNIKS